MYKSVIKVVAVCLAITSFHSYAALLSIDWQTSGDNLVTQDTVSGLNWLDLTETVNMSYTEVTAQLGSGGQFDGWRYATNDEVIALWNNYFGIDLSFDAPWSSTAPIDEGIVLASEFLGNNPSGINYPYIVLGLTSEYSFVIDTYPYYFHNYIGAYTYVDQDYVLNIYETIHVDTLYEDKNDTWVGSYLVQDINPVPLPAAFWLFGSGLIGLLVITRRKK